MFKSIKSAQIYKNAAQMRKHPSCIVPDALSADAAACPCSILCATLSITCATMKRDVDKVNGNNHIHQQQHQGLFQVRFPAHDLPQKLSTSAEKWLSGQ